MKKFYNITQAVYIEVLDATPSNYYKYKKAKWYRPEGVYSPMEYIGDVQCIVTTSGFFLENNIVYEKPRVVVYFAKNVFKKYHFDTYEKALEKAEELKKLNGIWI